VPDFDERHGNPSQRATSVLFVSSGTPSRCDEDRHSQRFPLASSWVGIGATRALSCCILDSFWPACGAVSLPHSTTGLCLIMLITQSNRMVRSTLRPASLAGISSALTPLALLIFAVIRGQERFRFRHLGASVSTSLTSRTRSVEPHSSAHWTFCRPFNEKGATHPGCNTFPEGFTFALDSNAQAFGTRSITSAQRMPSRANRRCATKQTLLRLDGRVPPES
jgi:hypothetical protein